MSRPQPIELERSEIERSSPSTWLVQVGSASDPFKEPKIFPLDGVEGVILGREDATSAGLPNQISVPDAWMSSRHAELRRTEEGWRLSDLGSSNGTLTWGRRGSTSLLGDGDMFETGSTFWLFRSEPTTVPLPKQPVGDGPLRTICPRLVDLHQKLGKMAKSRVPLVLQGPTGAGKEVLARAAHAQSGRTGRLVPLDVGTIPPHLVAHELFGVAAGVEGQEKERTGRLRAADQGTILIDQLGDMPSEVQVGLLRAIQNGEITPVGADSPVPIDVRFMCTTHEDIDALVDARRFRADLWSRLKGFVIRVPPLKERLEDLGLFVARLIPKYGIDNISFSPAAYRALLGYSWPHNVRELERSIESSAALCDGKRIELTDLPHDIQAYRPPRASVERSSEENRERELVRLLTAHKGNVSAVARSMGYSRMQVHRWMKQMSVNPNDYRG